MTQTIPAPVDARGFRAVVRRDLPRMKVREVHVVQRGRDNVVFEVDGVWIFRFPRDDQVRFDGELKLLRHLHGRMPVPTPDVRFVGRRPSYMGYPKLGDDVLGDDIRSADASAMRALAEFLAALHAIGITTAEELAVPRRPFVKDSEELTRLLRTACRDDDWLGFALGCVDRVAALRHAENEERLLHHDLHGDNVVAQEGGRRIVGVIDFGDACIGDMHRDFVGMCWHGFEALGRLLTAYEGITGRMLELRRIKDYFCVTNLRDILWLRGRPRVPVEDRMLARSERRLADWAQQERLGSW